MSAICQQLNLTDPFDAAVFTCLTMCFYAAARVGELTVPRLGTFNITHHVTPVDLHTENNQKSQSCTSPKQKWPQLKVKTSSGVTNMAPQILAQL